MNRYIVCALYITTLYPSEYVPKGSQRVPPVNCVWRVPEAMGLYKVPSAGFMVKLAKNRWRKAHILDDHQLVNESSYRGFMHMDGLFLIVPLAHGGYGIKTYWPNDHMKLFCAKMMEGALLGMGEDYKEQETNKE